MNKKLYIAVTVEENGKFYSWVHITKANNNLIDVLSSIQNIITANVCDTLKSAKEIVLAWNETYKRNGTYIFSKPF